MAAEPLTEPPGFAALAKRISAWTTRVLLTLLVLVAGLGFGQQVIKWWAADTPPGTPAVVLPADPLGNPSQFHTLQFGDNSWSLRRRSIAGDKRRAVEQLRAACREALSSSPLPLAGEGQRVKAAGEEEFLTFLSNSTPVDQEPGQWRLYELHEAFPMSVGVARVGQAPSPAQGRLAQMGYRVVIWGVAVPTGDDEWTLCTFQPEAPSVGGNSGLTDVPLPPEGRRILSMRAAGGGGITTFNGPDRPAECKKFYDDWFARQGWRPVTSWQPIGAAWYAKFAAPDRGGAIDIRFGPDGRGGLKGLLMMTPL